MRTFCTFQLFFRPPIFRKARSAHARGGEAKRFTGVAVVERGRNAIIEKK